MVKSKKYVLLQHFEGDPKKSDFEIVEEELPSLKDNEILVEAEYISVDIDMRLFPKLFNLSAPADMVGFQVARIIESKHKDFPVGRRVVGYLGWKTHTVYNPDEFRDGFGKPASLVPDLGAFSSSLALGTLGAYGNTAYFGFLEVCKPQAGEVVVVTVAAGTVGTIVGQIAKIKGCKVIGITGSDEKCKWLKEEMGLDAAINYKTADIQSALKEAAPDGVDCYFDTVGGEMSAKIISQLKNGARVCVCGFTSGYNVEVREKVTPVEEYVIMNEITMQGFNVFGKKWVHRWDEGICQIMKWIEEGKMKYSETIIEGFDKMFDTLMEVIRGQHRGKVVIKV